MRFTRKIPGIRLPIPGRRDDAAPGFELFSPGWVIALVFTLLLAILGIYLLCTLYFGGELAHFWLETRVLGLSLYAIATGVNLLLIGYALLAFLSMRRAGSSRGWKKVVGFLFVLGLLGCVQVFLNGWKDVARWDSERSQAHLEEQIETVEELRAKIAGPGGHVWSGEYVSHAGALEKRWLLAPDESACQVFQLEGYSEDAPLHERTRTFHSIRADVTIEAGRLRLSVGAWPPDTRYAVVAWGERRYLVASEKLDDFLAREGEPVDEDGIYLRIGDEQRPLEGRPAVVEDLR